jgi:hypothetical protein
LGISSAGAISGTPTTAGTYNGTITAANGVAPDATQAFTIVVGSEPVAPTITSAPPPGTGTVGMPYSHTVTATGTAPITFTATGLPPGLGISSAGAISGTPTTAGTYNGTIAAANGVAPDATQAFTIVVSATPATSIALISPANGQVFAAMAKIKLVAELLDPAGTVTNVEFFAGNMSLGSRRVEREDDDHGDDGEDRDHDGKDRDDDDEGDDDDDNGRVRRITLNWKQAPAGAHVLTVVAYHNTGASTVSSPVTIQVMAPQELPPTVRILHPEDGSRFFAGRRKLVLVAQARDTGGTVVSVEFFANANSLGMAEFVGHHDEDDEDDDGDRDNRGGGGDSHKKSKAVFALVWEDAPIGQYEITAVATDDTGATAISEPVQVSVVEMRRRGRGVQLRPRD